MSKPTKKATTPRQPVHGRQHRHQVRIIGGQWKRTVLDVITAEGLRPTPDRVRETLFNWLNHQLHSNWLGVTCLDLFAGSGALGFEAASRGAEKVVMVEVAGAACQQLHDVCTKLQATQVQIKRADANRVLPQMQAAGEKFDVIFLDPPFGKDSLATLLPACLPLLKPNGLLYAESELPLHLPKETTMRADLPWCAGWELLRADQAGLVHFHLLRASRPALDGTEVNSISKSMVSRRRAADSAVARQGKGNNDTIDLEME